MKEQVREEISVSVSENTSYLKNLFTDASDIVYRDFLVCNTKALIVYIDGMADKTLIDNFVMETLMDNNGNLNNIENVSELKDKILTVSDIKAVTSLSEGVDSLLSGDTLLFIDGLKECYVISTRFWPARGITEPSGETVVRGGRDGFSETIRFNTALVRRRIRDTGLKMVSKKLGARSKTDVVIMYIDDIANKTILEDLNRRISQIDIDAVLDSGYVEQMIQDSKWSLFPQTQSTERPDVVAAALYEGRVAILVDNSPFAVIVPATLPSLFQSPDDYYQRWIFGSAMRIIRLFSAILAIILPALYVAITSFHPSIIPTKLAYFIAASREGVPFPAFIEAIIMEISLDLLIESVVRLPKPIGSTIGIVGGLIIGQAAVSAGIVSPIMIIIVSVTAITSFTTPNYEIASAFRLIRFLMIIAAAIVGLYGIVLSLILLLIHLVKLNSFGVPYLAPVVNPDINDFKDVYIRMPFNYFKTRPGYMKTKDKIRQK